VVDGDDLQGVPKGRPELLMSGRVAGVQVVSLPGGGIAVRIRGQGTLYGDSEPLYVIDGMPVRSEPGKGLSWLNSADIKRIEVLKDAIATSSYGMQGANGVVLITTRRGTDGR
jgi:TonB-dependent SusC/RagA subfamily outer membrane receptor